MTIIFGKNGFVGKSLDIPNAICPSSKECDLLDYKSVLKKKRFWIFFFA